jgi:putative ABC transport system permease protein
VLVLLRWVSLRRLIRSPLRSLLVLFGIALGVSTVVATLATTRSVRAAFGEMTERVSGRADLVITNGDVGLPLELVEQVDDVPEVAHVAGTIEIISREPGGEGPILILGLDFLGDRHFLTLAGEGDESEVVVDDPISFMNDPDAILIAKSLADRRGLGVGGTITLLTPDGPRPFTIRGILRDEGLASAFGGWVAVMFQEAAVAAFGGNERLDRIEIAIAKGQSRDSVQAKLKDLVGGRGRVEPPEGRTQHLVSILEPIERGLQVAGALALLVGMFIIYNAVGVAVAERRREIGLLRAFGVTRRGVVQMFSAEALVLAILGGALGVVLGANLADVALSQTYAPLSRFYAPIRPPAPKLELDIVLPAVLAGLFATLVAAWGPARLAATVDPAETLRRQAAKLRRTPLPHRTMALLGLGLVLPGIAIAKLGHLAGGFAAMALFLIAALLLVPALIIGLRRALLAPVSALFGIPGRIALDNAERRLDRSALTTGALMTAVSASISLGSWSDSLEASVIHWLDRALPADVYVTAGSPIADQHNMLFKPDILDQLEGLPGVRETYPVHTVTLDIMNKRVVLISLDIHDYFAAIARKKMSPIVLEGADPIPVESMADRPGIVISENTARKLRLRAGDELPIETPTGTHSFHIEAVVVDYSSDQGSALMHRKWYVEYWNDEMIDTVDLLLEDGASLPEVEKEVRNRLGRGSELFVVSARELRVEIKRILVDSLRIFRSTELIALLVALLGVIGTMLAAVIDRTRDIGVLRAIGATKKQILVSVITEAGFLGVVAVVGGVIAGLPMGWAFVRVVGLAGTGWLFEYVFPFEGAARIGLLVIVTAALAGLWPGRRAASLSVPEALAYE